MRNGGEEGYHSFVDRVMLWRKRRQERKEEKECRASCIFCSMGKEKRGGSFVLISVGERIGREEKVTNKRALAFFERRLSAAFFSAPP